VTKQEIEVQARRGRAAGLILGLWIEEAALSADRVKHVVAIADACGVHPTTPYRWADGREAMAERHWSAVEAVFPGIAIAERVDAMVEAIG